MALENMNYSLICVEELKVVGYFRFIADALEEASRLEARTGNTYKVHEVLKCHIK